MLMYIVFPDVAQINPRVLTLSVRSLFNDGEPNRFCSQSAIKIPGSVLTCFMIQSGSLAQIQNTQHRLVGSVLYQTSVGGGG